MKIKMRDIYDIQNAVDVLKILTFSYGGDGICTRFE